MSPRTQAAIDLINSQINAFARRRDWLTAHSNLIEQLDSTPTGYNMTFDFDYLPHEKTVQLIKVFPGKWTKKVEDGKVTYTREEIEGVTIRCWKGEPPPNCKIVEETTVVPAHMVEEKTVITHKLVCKETEQDQANENF